SLRGDGHRTVRAAAGGRAHPPRCWCPGRDRILPSVVRDGACARGHGGGRSRLVRGRSPRWAASPQADVSPLHRARHVRSARGGCVYTLGRALLIAKFLPGLNSIGQPLAGALGMPRWRFVIFDVLGAVLWVGLYVGLGYVLRDQLAEAARLAHRLGGWALVIVGGAVAAYLGMKVTRRQLLIRQLRIARISPEELEAKLNAGEPVVHRRSPPRPRHSGPPDDDSRGGPHPPRRARASARHDPAGPRGGALLLVTERGDERPCGAPLTKAGSLANPA